MSKDKIIMFSYELSSSPMDVNKEEIPEVKNIFQSGEDEEETSLGKRKINTIIKKDDEREVKRIAFSQEPLQEKEEDIDMIEEDTEREDHRVNDKVMEDNVLEEEYVVDFGGFF
ncbi:PREDICTED: uncharacterized protein LOC104716221 [Camelina sativa]|uniref:Uncharacterized protein LOC104716221 n=1 Tax=Camelina sativa TaxID=90675 RepID=A0ABM0TV34_CAMSA|nr:PREDICTED: uncharacterized protein LOC104716221 [Camelina sativa]